MRLKLPGKKFSTSMKKLFIICLFIASCTQKESKPVRMASDMVHEQQAEILRGKNMIFDFTHMVVNGSIIRDSKPQCIYVIKTLNGIMNKEQWEKDVRPLALKNGLADDVTWENLPERKLHENCRHEFVGAVLEDGDRIGTNEIYKDGKVIKINP